MKHENANRYQENKRMATTYPRGVLGSYDVVLVPRINNNYYYYSPRSRRSYLIILLLIRIIRLTKGRNQKDGNYP